MGSKISGAQEVGSAKMTPGVLYCASGPPMREDCTTDLAPCCEIYAGITVHRFCCVYVPSVIMHCPSEHSVEKHQLSRRALRFRYTGTIHHRSTPSSGTLAPRPRRRRTASCGLPLNWMRPASM